MLEKSDASSFLTFPIVFRSITRKNKKHKKEKQKILNFCIKTKYVKQQQYNI